MSIQIKTIDSDGVVVNSEPLYEQSGRELFRQYDVVIRNNDWQEFKALHPMIFPFTPRLISTSRQLMNWIYNNTKIENHFDFSILAEDVINTKPQPEPFLR